MIDFRKIVETKMAAHCWTVPDLVKRIYKNQDFEVGHQAVYNFLSGKSQILSDALQAILNELGTEIK